MQIFLDLIQRNEQLNALMSRVAEMRGHQGTIIRFSNTFLNLHVARMSLPNSTFEELLYYYGPRYNFRGDFPYWAIMSLGEMDFNTYTPEKTEVEFLANLLKETGYSHIKPFEVVFAIYNDASIEQFEEVGRAYNYYSDFRIVIERRGRNNSLNARHMHTPLKGGISISGDTQTEYGTLGGILKNKESERFGVTCSHVLPSVGEAVFQPAKYDSSKTSREIGKVSTASIIKYCNRSSPCNPYDSKSNMDLALVELGIKEKSVCAIHELGAVTTIRQIRTIHQGMTVEMNGRTTNRRKHLTVGGLCASYKVAYDLGDTQEAIACFTNLIELKSDPINILGSRYYLHESPVQSGDSGAWICSSDSTGYSWCGMLISGDADRGYFLPSEHIMGWLKSQGHDLSL